MPRRKGGGFHSRFIYQRSGLLGRRDVLFSLRQGMGGVTMTAPKISVIVPVYKVEAYVEKCLASLAGQTYPHIEVIVVDDCSPDGSGQICRGWAARDSRFQVIRLPENQGLSAARNEGIRRASGDYIAFVDSDDYTAPDLLEKLYQALAANHADISVCKDSGLGLKDGPLQVLSPSEAARCLAQRSLFLWTAWGKLFPAELVRQVYFEKQALCCEDFLFFYQILKRVRRVVYIPDLLYHYVYREGSLINRGITEERCMVLSVLEQICEDAAIHFPEAEAAFRQVALDTAARLFMQALEHGADGDIRDYRKRFRDHTRRHFSRRAFALCPDGRSRAAELALYAGAPAFEALAVVYLLIKSLRKSWMG